MYEIEIEAGAAILDREHPDWELLIDPATLQLSHSYNCVLGQVTGSFYREYDVLIPEGHLATEYGFLIPFECDVKPHVTDSCCWSRLTEEWITFVKQRLNEGVTIGSELLAPTV